MYGVRTDETMADPVLINRYDYDGIFGTALNRFVVQVRTANTHGIRGSGPEAPRSPGAQSHVNGGSHGKGY